MVKNGKKWLEAYKKKRGIDLRTLLTYIKIKIYRIEVTERE